MPYPSSNTSYLPAEMLGQYQLGQPVVVGKRATIYKNWHKQQPVAIKVLHPHLARRKNELIRFYDDAKLSLQLEHPQIIQTLEVSEHRGFHYQVMPWAEQGTLKDFIRKQGPLWEDEAIRITDTIRQGLGELQRLIGYHGRLHPGNILMFDAHTPVITGVSRLPVCRDPALKKDSRVPDLVACAAPEVLGNKHSLNEKIDEFSLTSITYFMITGRLPTGRSSIQKLTQTRKATRSTHWLPSETSIGVVETLRNGMQTCSRKRNSSQRNMHSGLTRIDDYTIQELLSNGKHAWIYRASDAGGRNLVLKVLRPHLARSRSHIVRFYQEARLFLQLDHPNLPRGLQVDQTGEHHFSAIEYIKGQSLKQKLLTEGSLSEIQTLSLMRQAVAATIELHQKNYIHRNLKLSRFLVDEYGKVALINLGVSKPQQTNYGLTCPNQRIGSPQHIAPEQFQSNYQPHPQGDVYSLGVMLFQLMSSRLPFARGTVVEQFTRKKKNQHLSLRKLCPHISERTECLVMQAIHADRSIRFQTATELLTEIDGCLTELALHDHDLATETEYAQDCLPKAGQQIKQRPLARGLAWGSQVCAVLSLLPQAR